MLISMSLSARNTPLAVRERFSLQAEELSEIGRSLRAHTSELIVVSTCNRVEVYAVPTTRMLPQCLVGLFAQQRGVDPSIVEPYVQTAQNRDAARHLFRVVAGLESMVVGEAQISGQVRRSLEAAEQASLIGHRLGALVRHALLAGGRVRQETALGRGGLSVPRVAVEQACRELGDPAGHTALLLGAGETAQLAASALTGFDRLIIANRTLSRAEAVADALGGVAISLREVPEALTSADLVVGCVGATRPVITHGTVAAAQRQRANRPMTFVDLAVPRCIDPSVVEVPGVRLMTIADVSERCSSHLNERLAAVPSAEAIVLAELERAWRTWEAADARETVMALRHWANSVRREKLDRAARGPRALSAEQVEAVDLLTRSLVDRLLHAPTIWLRTHPEAAAGVVKEMFGLEGAS
ncbi:MAG: glutamyl-tRNA reductase [Chloroflexota bacterium]